MKFKGKKYSFYVKSVKLPNGKTTKLDFLDHPGASLMIPFVTPSKVIMIRQFRGSVGKYMYEFPAGTLDPKETPLQCAKREIAEETGFAARTWKKLGQIYPAPGYTNEIIYIYTAENLYEKKAQADADEVIETKILTRPQIKKLFQNGVIQDAKTICALAFCGWI